MFKKTLLTLICLYSGVSLSGAVEHEIDTKEVLKCTLSNIHQNRIAVESGRVRRILAPDDIFNFRVDEESGNALLFPTGNFVRPVTISIFTSNNFVQDVEVSPSSTSSQTIILKEQIEKRDLDLNNGIDPQVEMIKNVVKGKIPDGYVEGESPKTFFKIGKDVKVRGTTLWQGPYEHIVFFEVKNISSKREALIKPKDFKFKNTKWVYLSKELLQPDAKAWVAIAVTEEDNVQSK